MSSKTKTNDIDTNTNNTIETEEKRAAFVAAIREAFEFRAAIFARGNWSREEMIAANDRIIRAQSEMAQLCAAS